MKNHLIKEDHTFYDNTDISLPYKKILVLD